VSTADELLRDLAGSTEHHFESLFRRQAEQVVELEGKLAVLVVFPRTNLENRRHRSLRIDAMITRWIADGRRRRSAPGCPGALE